MFDTAIAIMAGLMIIPAVFAFSGGDPDTCLLYTSSTRRKKHSLAQRALPSRLSRRTATAFRFDGVREYLTLCDTLGKMYRYCDQSAWDVTEQLAITWGNGVLYDPDRELETDLRLVAAQLLKPEIAVARHFDQPWADEEDLKNVREKYMPAMEELEPEA